MSRPVGNPVLKEKDCTIICIFLLFANGKIDPNFNLSSLGLVLLVSKTKSAFSLRGAINLSSLFIDSSRLFSPETGEVF